MVKFTRNNKGWARIIELALAATLLFAFLLYIQESQASLVSTAPKWDRATLKMYGEDVFLSLDKRDVEDDKSTDLRDLLISGVSCVNDWENLVRNISMSFPKNIAFTIYLIDENENIIYEGGVETSQQPTNRELVSTYYIVAGNKGTFCNVWSPCLLKLVTWFNE